MKSSRILGEQHNSNLIYLEPNFLREPQLENFLPHANLFSGSQQHSIQKRFTWLLVKSFPTKMI